MFKSFAKPNLDKIKPKLLTLFEKEHATQGQQFEHEVVLRVITKTLFDIGLKNDIRIDQVKGKPYFEWLGSDDNQDNKFYKEFFEDRLIDSIEQQYEK